MAAATRMVFRLHAVRRMAERSISVDDVKEILARGRTIEEYADAEPYPSRLILGWRDERPLHVVAADNGTADETVVVTVYEPDPSRWDNDFTRRKRP